MIYYSIVVVTHTKKDLMETMKMTRPPLMVHRVVVFEVNHRRVERRTLKGH